MRAAGFLAAAGLLGSACARPSAPTAQIHLETTSAGPNTLVTLVAAPGLKVNARLKPALEQPDGTVLRLDSPRLTPDSAYFTEPPKALVEGRHRRLRGRLRASVCGVHELVCRSVTLEL